MIKILGFKRIVVLLALIAVNALVASVLYLHIAPATQSVSRVERQKQSEVSAKDEDVRRLRIEYDQAEEQHEQYEELRQAGFFNNQDRREAERIFNRIQTEAGVITARASLEAPVFIDDVEAAKANHRMMRSNINVSIEALDDIDVYKYIYLVERFFPGFVKFDSIFISRKAKITSPILRSVAGGGNPVMVTAQIKMTWLTMVPRGDDNVQN